MIATLLERDAELAVARDRLARAGRGEGAVLVIEGAAGTGKTSLLRALEAHARDEAFTVLSARASGLSAASRSAWCARRSGTTSCPPAPKTSRSWLSTRCSGTSRAAPSTTPCCSLSTTSIGPTSRPCASRLCARPRRVDPGADRRDRAARRGGAGVAAGRDGHDRRGRGGRRARARAGAARRRSRPGLRARVPDHHGRQPVPAGRAAAHARGRRADCAECPSRRRGQSGERRPLGRSRLQRLGDDAARLAARWPCSAMARCSRWRLGSPSSTIARRPRPPTRCRAPG